MGFPLSPTKYWQKSEEVGKEPFLVNRILAEDFIHVFLGEKPISKGKRAETAQSFREFKGNRDFERRSVPKNYWLCFPLSLALHSSQQCQLRDLYIESFPCCDLLSYFFSLSAPIPCLLASFACPLELPSQHYTLFPFRFHDIHYRSMKSFTRVKVCERCKRIIPLINLINLLFVIHFIGIVFFFHT